MQPMNEAPHCDAHVWHLCNYDVCLGVVVRPKPYIDEARLIAEQSSAPQATPDHPVSFIHAPIGDASGSTLPDAALSELVLLLLSHILAGEILYIQCSDGNGRSGTGVRVCVCVCLCVCL